MNHKLFTRSAVGAMFATATLLVTTSVAAGPMNSIADSWHNLGSSAGKTVTPNGNPVRNHSSATGEICVFCHTPHGGDNTAAVPIWNRQLNNPAIYTRYSDLGSSTFDAQEAPIGSVSIACLSCHDGTQAIDSLINAPGSGGYTDISNGAVTIPQLGGFTGGDQTAGRISPGLVQNLGTDLSNDHPVSMQYGGGGVTGSAGTVNGTTNDPDFAQPSGMPAPSATVNTLFWVENTSGSIGAQRDRSDIILYTRNADGLGAIEPFVECGSCHDPHNVENPTFLRISNGNTDTGTYPNQTTGTNKGNTVTGSGLCLTCHNK